MIPQRWYKCALCRESTQHTVAANRLLSRWNAARLLTGPHQCVPGALWATDTKRCARPARAGRAGAGPDWPAPRSGR